MKNVIKILSNCLNLFINTIVTQDFKLEGCTYITSIPQLNSTLYLKGMKPILCFHGKQWEKNRNAFMLEKHGLTIEEMDKPENAFKFVVKCNYQFS